MNLFTKSILLFSALFFTSQAIFGQSEIQIFGFFQSTLTKLDGGYTVVADVPPAIFGTSKLTLSQQHENYLSPYIQQLNIFARKEIDQNFTAWVNLEITGSYNSSLKWGNFSLQEAWINYQANDAFNIKAGLLIPRFAYLNEIKNRTILLPYITRPLVYESSISDIDQSDYVPERAFLQVYGNLNFGKIIFDYAAFVGPSESSYITSTGAIGGNSVDTTNFKLFGGRIGIKIGEFRFGVSGTTDKDNQQNSIKEDVPRTRLAFDLGYSAYNFFFDSEFISVHLSPNNSTQNMDKQFYYGTLGYNFTDKLFGFGSYSYLKDNNNSIFKAGLKSVVFGIGYKPVEAVVVKANYSNYFGNSSFPTSLDPSLPDVNTTVDLNVKAYQIAVSVLF